MEALFLSNPERHLVRSLGTVSVELLRRFTPEECGCSDTDHVTQGSSSLFEHRPSQGSSLAVKEATGKQW